MRIIYKYQIPALPEFTLDLPKGAEIIRVEDVNGMFFLWAQVDTTAQIEKRYFQSYKTGQEFIDNSPLRFLGVCKMNIGMEIAFYVFESFKYKKSEFKYF